MYSAALLILWVVVQPILLVKILPVQVLKWYVVQLIYIMNSLLIVSLTLSRHKIPHIAYYLLFYVFIVVVFPPFSSSIDLCIFSLWTIIIHHHHDSRFFSLSLSLSLSISVVFLLLLPPLIPYILLSPYTTHTNTHTRPTRRHHTYFWMMFWNPRLRTLSFWWWICIDTLTAGH